MKNKILTCLIICFVFCLCGCNTENNFKFEKEKFCANIIIDFSMEYFLNPATIIINRVNLEYTNEENIDGVLTAIIQSQNNYGTYEMAKYELYFFNKDYSNFSRTIVENIVSNVNVQKVNQFIYEFWSE